jgi:hypothetical protein
MCPRSLLHFSQCVQLCILTRAVSVTIFQRSFKYLRNYCSHGTSRNSEWISNLPELYPYRQIFAYKEIIYKLFYICFHVKWRQSRSNGKICQSHFSGDGREQSPCYRATWPTSLLCCLYGVLIHQDRPKTILRIQIFATYLSQLRMNTILQMLNLKRKLISVEARVNLPSRSNWTRLLIKFNFPALNSGTN